MAVPDNYQTVSVYLPPELAQKVKDYAIEHNLTRKSKAGDKPALGTAVVEILATIFNSPLPSKVLARTSPLLDNVLSTVLERLDRLESITSQLQNTQLDPINATTSTLPSNVLEQSSHLPFQTSIGLPELETSQPLELDSRQSLNSTLLGNVPEQSSHLPFQTSIGLPEPETSQPLELDSQQSLNSTLLSTLPSQVPTEQILDPKQWDEPLAELVRTGISTTEIATELTQMGYTNSKGNPIDRKSIESKFKQHPDLKTAYDNVRKSPAPTTVKPTPPVQTEIVLTAVQTKDLQQINDRVGKVTTAKSKKLLDLGLIVQIGEDLILTKQGEKVLAKHQT